MPTERSDKLYSSWRESTEKFDYFMLGVTCALCAYISQNYQPAKVGLNPGTLELGALLVLVLGTVTGFRRIERTLQATSINHRLLHAYEARGALVSEMADGKPLLNQSTGQVYTPEAAQAHVVALSNSIDALEREIAPVKRDALKQYRLRNGLTLAGFLLLLAARLWSAYN